MRTYVCFALAAISCAAAVRLDNTAQIVDLRKHEWQHLVATENQTPEQALSATGWKPIRVGWRWNELGFPGLDRQTVWLKIAFAVPASLKGRSVGFFFTEVDDEADIYLNGRKVGAARYELGYAIPGPTVINLTEHVQYDKPNELMLQIRDKYVRSPGLLGNVLLYQTIPFRRTPEGGILAGNGDYTVLLHAGDGVLARGERTVFPSHELRTMHAPSYILREDELIVVAPANEVQTPPPHKVDLDQVSPLIAKDPLAISAGTLPLSVPLYDRLDIALNVSGSWRNPFDPREISVQAVVLTPSKRVEKVQAFFRQDFRAVSLNDEEEILLPVKGTPWIVYYRPRETGEHTVEVFAQDKTGVVKYSAGKFTAVPSKAPGYLRVSRNDPRFFEYDNGDSFFGIGPSGWYRGRNYVFGGNPRWVPATMMDAYYQRKASAGSNYEYLGTFHYGRLLTAGAVMDQHIAWKLERSLRTMERLGIRWLFFHDDIRRYYRYGVDALPYSKAQGGSVSSFNELYTDRQALDWQKNQLLYIVARMADSPSIWMWNIGDEWRDQPGNKFSVPLVRSWMKELHEYVRGIDIYGHPHAIGEGEEAILNGGDVLPIEGWYLNHPPHKNGDWRNGRKHDLVDEVQRQIAPYANAKFPVIDVEGGLYGWNSGIYNSGKPWGYPEELTFHQHLWLSLFLKSAAGGTEWLNNVLDHDGKMFHARSFARFLEGESLTRTQWSQATATASTEPLNAWALTSKGKTLAWVLNRSYNWLDHVDGKRGVPVKDASVTLPVDSDGLWNVELWDTTAGKITRKATAQAAAGKVTVPLGEVAMDVALKLRKGN